MQNIGRYKQMTEFTTENAGTAEWCRASLDGVDYFVKKFQSPVYPSADVELPEKKMKARILRFHTALETKKKLYERLEAQNSSGALLVPVEVMNYQYHICTIAEFVTGNVRPKDVCHLNPWQRLVLMRTLTKALMNVHAAGVVHSDMKPENVVIEQSEEGNCRLRLIDFDGSFFMENAPSKADEVHGDPAYFSPEAYRLSLGEEVTLDYRIDIFALGMIMHYFWCGALPGKPTDQTVGECVLRGGSIVLDESLPLALRMTIMKMLDADPDRRLSLQSVDQVLAEQIKRYPARPLVVIAARKPLKERDKRVERGGEKKEESRYTDKEHTGAGDTSSITVLEVDTKGNTIRSKKVDVAFGGSAVIKARSIEGYRLISDTERKVTVSKTGLASNSTVRFTYERIAKKRMSTSSIVWLIILGLAVTIGIVIAITNGNRPDLTDPSHRVSTIMPGGAKTVSRSQTYYFTPEETGMYRIRSETISNRDPFVELNRWNGKSYESVDSQDDAGYYTRNFDITNRLEKGTTYQIYCGGSGSGSYYVYLERAE